MKIAILVLIFLTTSLTADAKTPAQWKGTYERVSGGGMNCNYILTVGDKFITYKYLNNCPVDALRSVRLFIVRVTTSRNQAVLYYSNNDILVFRYLPSKELFKVSEERLFWGKSLDDIIWEQQGSNVFYKKIDQ